MIKIDKEVKVWTTSDTHYSHKNICRGVTNWRLPNGDVPESQTRPFETLEKMNASIVNNINGLVGQDDVLIHMGDWSFGGFENIEKDGALTRRFQQVLVEEPTLDETRRFARHMHV